MTDLWPDDITHVEIKAPVALLREQAAMLGRKTRNVVTAEVRQADPVRVASLNYSAFSYSFSLVAPSLGGYTYRLFDITHGVAMYPVRVIPDDAIGKELGLKDTFVGLQARGFTANTEADFLELLATIFRSAKTRHVIQAMIAQSAEA
jgi:hypothetical protein